MCPCVNSRAFHQAEGLEQIGYLFVPVYLVVPSAGFFLPFGQHSSAPSEESFSRRVCVFFIRVVCSAVPMRPCGKTKRSAGLRTGMAVGSAS